MADFVAVIRRAVDGLTDNTPELRTRVYEKARSAVVRQLENMNPRPPEAMFQRQLDKLDAAIRQVEEENSEAQPAQAVPAVARPAVEAQPIADPRQPAETTVPAQPVEAVSDRVEEAAPVAVRAEAAHTPLEDVHAEPAHEAADAGPAALAFAEGVETQPAAVDSAAVRDNVAPAHAGLASYAPVEADEPARQFAAEPVALVEPITPIEPVLHAEPTHDREPQPVIDEERSGHVASNDAEQGRGAVPTEPVDVYAGAQPAIADRTLEAARHLAVPVEEAAPWPEPARDVSAHHEESRFPEPALPHDEPARHREPLRHADADVRDDQLEAGRAATVAEVVPQFTDVRKALEDDDPLLSHFEPVREPALRHAANRVMEEPVFDAESEFPGGDAEQPGAAEHAARAVFSPEPVRHTPVASPVAEMPRWEIDIDRQPETLVETPAHEAEMPRAALTEADVANDFSDFLKTEFSTPAVQPPPARKEPESEFSWDAPFDDLPDLPKPIAFEEALHARQEQMAREPERKTAQPLDARAELEDLIGYTPADKAPRIGAEGERATPDMARAMSKLEGKSFRVHKKKRGFNPLPIAFGIAAALVVAGGALAVYTYHDDVSALVASLMPSDKAPASSETRAVEKKPADQSSSKTDEAAKTDTAVNAADPATQPAATEEEPTEVASLDNNIGATKFTQRLLEDGTETETDAAKIPVDQSLSEGKTIAGQTELAANETAPATKTDQVAEKPGLAVAQKMFLYEERLGDSPVAVPGTVSWALKNDTTNAGGKEQPMIEATVEVPDRKLKAIVSFKRNTDPSLPASHIIEVVFDLPENFPEGNVESVQRIAFKQTEQDRGNSLIAVPAKITDDFHMIALNDDADARKVNTELMKTRSWIDIPIVYRNNRRALITFEKGSTGTEAFEKALAQWAALGPTATSN